MGEISGPSYESPDLGSGTDSRRVCESTGTSDAPAGWDQAAAAPTP